ncbi:MAG: hypothetical protein Q9211_005817 [Gyalolechia sp. 1 TL-2023]
MTRSAIGAFNYQSIGHTVFAVGRFLSALAGLLFEPRWILMVLYICLVITSTLAMNLTGSAGVSMVILILFFESGVFSIIFAMCLRGLGSKTRLGSVLLTTATSGGAVIPVMMNPVNDSRGIRYGFCVAVAVFSFGLLLPLYATVLPDARRQVDPVHKPSSGRSKPMRPRRLMKMSKALSARASKGNRSWDLPAREHVEDRKEEVPG